MRDKILTIDFSVYGFRVAYIYILAYLEEQRRKKVRKISTCMYVETVRQRE
jgi:hypothetical protein